MKKSIQNTLVVGSLFLSFHGFAGIEIPHVAEYDLAHGDSLWAETKADTVPTALLNRSMIDSPRLAYSRVFPKSFLQEELLAVCYQDCKKKDLIKVSGSAIEAKDKDAFEQANVYFWLRNYFSFLEERFAFKPTKYLKVMTNRSIKDPTAGKKMKNNAFFNPQDVSLSFLPASNSILFNAFNGKINRSGYDPSVIAHEASHYFFHHLFPDAINYEISGLNEGFADYVANLLLNNPKVGNVMLRGKTLRDSSSLVDGAGKLKAYAPKLESHDLGERVSMVLWQSRKEASNPEEFDRLVIDAVRGISANPFATIHTFKTELLKRIPMVIPASKMNSVRAVLEIGLPGEETTIQDTSFLSKSTNIQAYLGFKMNQTISKRFADEMGVEEHNNQGFMFFREVALPNEQVAYLMGSENPNIRDAYWYVMDKKTDNVLGIFGTNGKLLTDRNQLKTLDDLTSQVVGQNETVTDFIKKTRMFVEFAEGKGEIAKGYKVKSTKTIPAQMSFNDSPLAVDRIEIAVKKKLLINLLVGLPDIDQITVITTNLNIPALPELNGKRVIGYKLRFSNGTATEMILNKYAKQAE